MLLHLYIHFSPRCSKFRPTPHKPEKLNIHIFSKELKFLIIEANEILL
jgi:hypothetical protein